MKKCPKCGLSFEDAYNVCTSCGTLLEKVPALKGRMGSKTIGEAAGAASPGEDVHTASKLKGKMGGKTLGEGTPSIPEPGAKPKTEADPGPKEPQKTETETVVVSGKLKGKVGNTEFHVESGPNGVPMGHVPTEDEKPKGPYTDVPSNPGPAVVPVREPSSESRTPDRKWIAIVAGIAAALLLTILTAVLISVIRKENNSPGDEPTRAAANEPAGEPSDSPTRHSEESSEPTKPSPTTTTPAPTTTTPAPTTTTPAPTTTTAAPVLPDGQYYGEISSYDGRTITFRMLSYFVFSVDAGNMIWDYTGEVKTLDYTRASVRLAEVFGYQLSESWGGGEVQCTSLDDAYRKMDSVGGRSPFVYFVVRNGVITDIVFQYVA